jgi:glycosyltransferase involved in cell wall biosynthesis
VNHAGFFLSHRLPVALHAKERGFEVWVATPASKHVRIIEQHGLHWRRIGMDRSSIGPISELRSFVHLVRLYRSVRPDIVHHVTSKPVLYGTLAARLTRVPGVVNAISGLGHLWVGTELQVSGWRRAVSLGWRLCLRHPNMKVIFQNTQQRDLFVRQRWVRGGEDVLIRGSGVDLALFRSVERESAPKTQPLVVLAARMIETKGVRHFVEAARRLKSAGVSARFALVGEPDPDNPASVSDEQLQTWAQQGVVEHWGRRDDMPEVFAQADLVCLPTYYPEGVPKVLIEAAASGVAIVTTAIPGCMDIVKHEENGLLVPAGDVEALTSAIRRLLEDPDERKRMGATGRRMAEKDFDVRTVCDATFDIYQDLMARKIFD